MIKTTKEIVANIKIPQNIVTNFCQKHHIKKLSLFGSVLTINFNDQSDIDVLVEFDTKHIPSLITLAKMELELSAILNRQVDLRTPEDLSKYFRQQVLDSAVVQYVKQQ